MTPSYDDFDFDKPIEEWSDEEISELMTAVAEIDDCFAEILYNQSSDSASESDEEADGGAAA